MNPSLSNHDPCAVLSTMDLNPSTALKLLSTRGGGILTALCPRERRSMSPQAKRRRMSASPGRAALEREMRPTEPQKPGERLSDAAFLAFRDLNHVVSFANFEERLRGTLTGTPDQVIPPLPYFRSLARSLSLSLTRVARVRIYGAPSTATRPMLFCSFARSLSQLNRSLGPLSRSVRHSLGCSLTRRVPGSATQRKKAAETEYRLYVELFKAEDGINKGEAMRFFNAHKDEEWLWERYNPEGKARVLARRAAAAKAEQDRFYSTELDWDTLWVPGLVMEMVVDHAPTGRPDKRRSAPPPVAPPTGHPLHRLPSHRSLHGSAPPVGPTPAALTGLPPTGRPHEAPTGGRGRGRRVGHRSHGRVQSSLGPRG